MSDDTYTSVADVHDSPSLLRRVIAAASTESEADPEAWAQAHRWQYAAAPGWGAAFASAEAGGNQDPGAADDVITDAQILTEVQRIQGLP